MGALKQDKLARYVELVADPGFLELVCQRLACGETLSAITQSLEVPYSRIMYWLMDDDDRYTRYERALVAQARYEVDQALEIADAVTDKDDVAAARLRTDVRFKRAKHHAPKEYGDAQERGGGVTQVVLVDFRRPEGASSGGRVIDVAPQPKRVGVGVESQA